MTIQAIETRYKGYRFRSRLEARWAVFFDALGIEWEYEKEGYDLGEAGLYLPDFWLPQVKMWAEVKPLDLSPDERGKCEDLVITTGYPCLLLVGIPDHKIYTALIWRKGVAEQSYYLTAHHISEGRFYWTWGDDGSDFNDTHRAVSTSRSARFEHGETPQITERVVYREIERDSLVWENVDVLTRTMPNGFVCTIHLNDYGRPLCAPLDEKKSGGFSLGKWTAERKNVRVSSICRRCVKYALSRSKRSRQSDR